MFWKKKEPCFHEWKVSDYFTYHDSMGDIENYYEITCIKCKTQRNLDEYHYENMHEKGFIIK